MVAISPRRAALGVAILASILIVAPPARAQLAVLDSANLEQTSQTLAGTLRILDQAKQTLSQLTSVSSVLGTAGAASGGLAAPLRNLGASLAMPTVSFETWNLPRELQNPNIGSFSSVREFIGETLAGVAPDKKNNIGFGSASAVQQRRSRAVHDASANGYALAIRQRQTVQPAIERAAALADQATSAATLIDELRATNSLLAQIAGELTAQRQLAIAELELRSAEALASAPVIFTSAVNSNPATAVGTQAVGSGLLGD